MNERFLLFFSEISWPHQVLSSPSRASSLKQNFFLSTNVFDTFDCLVAADVRVGSESSFSEAAAAVSTNVKIMLWEDQTQQDRLNLNYETTASSGAVSLDEQSHMDDVLADWWHCSQYARKSAESDAEGRAAASRYYRTVDGNA